MPRILIKHQQDNKMTYESTKDVIIPFGKYKGRSFSNLSQTDKGCIYLLWLYDRKQDELDHFSLQLKAFIESDKFKTACSILVDDMDITEHVFNDFIRSEIMDAGFDYGYFDD